MKPEEYRAVGKSISFQPYSLYAAAVAYGSRQRPRRTVSSVICEALACFLSERAESVPDLALEGELLLAAEQVGARRALELLQREAQRMAAGRKEGAACVRRA